MRLSSLSNQRVLIIGGAGFLGRHITAAFVEAGSNVRVLDVVQAPPSAPEVEWIVGSTGDGTLVASAISGCTIAVFLANASLPGSSGADLEAEVRNHVAAAVHTAETCGALGVRHFLFASSGGTVYGFEPPEGEGLNVGMPTRPRNAYGVSKLAIEHYLRLVGEMRPMRTMSLRIANPYGEGQRAIRGQGFVAAAMHYAIAREAMPIWGDGSVERDFIHVSDVARAFTMAAVYGGSEAVLNVGSGQSMALNVMLPMIEKAIGLPVPVRYEAERQIDVHTNRLDIRLTTEELGWAPRVELPDGLARTARWWLSPSP